MSLAKPDVQKFMKRLRKTNPLKLSYYLVGEYGGKTKRPHYHIILFNARLDTIAPAWGLGSCHFGTVEAASIGYCLKYISKPTRIPQFKTDDRQKEFALMSKGLGLSYLTPAMTAWHNATDDRLYANLPDGKKCTLPRYFKERLFTQDKRNAISLHYELLHLQKLQEQKFPENFHRHYLNHKAAVQAAFKHQSFTLKSDKL